MSIVNTLQSTLLNMSIAQKYARHCNETYASSADSPLSALKIDPGPPPTSRIAIITCMDARLDVFKMFGLQLGEAHVIRVGGGRAADALRSLVASEHILQTKEIMVVHHTDCGFSKASTEDEARKIVRTSLGGRSVDHINLMPFGDQLEQSVKDDVQYLKDSPYVYDKATISGWVYDTAQGTISEIKE